MGANTSKPEEPLIFYSPSRASLTIDTGLLAELNGTPAKHESKENFNRDQQKNRKNENFNQNQNFKQSIESLNNQTYESKSTNLSSFNEDDLQQFINKRVQIEIERLQHEQELLLKETSDLRLHDTSYLSQHIQEISKTYKIREPTHFKDAEQKREELIACYSNHLKQPLDCYAQVEAFKQAVGVAQQTYIHKAQA